MNLSGCTSNEQNVKQDITNINEDTLLQEIMNTPEFYGFGQFIFPSDYRAINASMTIDDLPSLLPYHTNIQNETTIEVINEMFNRVSANETLFYDIYSEEEKREDPLKEDTGLFFFKGEKNAPFAIINAGGGFSYVGSIHESFPHALELSKQGYNAFALQYRTGGAQVACEDLAAAIAFVFNHAEELEVNVDDYSLWGGSAGARMAAYLGSYGTQAFNQKEYPKPSTIIMQYTGHNEYSENDPPTYACVGKNDGIANWQVMQRRINNLNDLGIDTQFEVYPNLGHGFGLGTNTSAEGWINNAISFWESHIN